MGFKHFVAAMKKPGILVLLCLLTTLGQVKAQPAKLELHRIWAVDLDQGVTVLELADFNGDGVEEIFIGSFSDSGFIHIFDATDEIQVGRSPGTIGRVTAIAVGDIDNDSIAEIVAGTDGGYLYVLNSDDLTVQWISDTVKVLEEPTDTSISMFNTEIRSIALSDHDGDDTMKVFIGTYTHYAVSYDSPHRWFHIEKRGSLFEMNPKTYRFSRIGPGAAFSKLKIDDIGEDGFEHLICGATFYIYYFELLSPFLEESISIFLYQNQALDEIYSSLEAFATTYEEELFPVFTGLITGNCDPDEAKEIVSSFEYPAGSYSDPTHVVELLVIDGDSLKIELILSNTIQSEGDRISGLAIHDVTNQLPGEILVARQEGFIEALDGTTGALIATSDTLPSISFFAFGDVNGDAMPEICISDGDSLFVYSTPVTAVEEENQENLVSAFVLNQNYPNPFNAQTNISYYLPQSSNLELSIYNIKGRKVKTLVNAFQSAGFQSITWDGTNKNGAEVASGVYFYRVQTDYSEETKKMVLLK